MNCFYGMVNRRKAFNLITSWEHCITRQNHCQRSSPLQISDTLQAGFEPAQNLKLGFDEFSSILFFRGKIINFLFPHKSLLASTFWGYVPVSSRLYVPVSSRLYCLLTYLFEPFVQRLIALCTAFNCVSNRTSYTFFEHQLLRKKCPYSELFWSELSRISTEYGEYLSVFSPNGGKCRPE